MSARRAVITGYGIVCALGKNKSEVLENIEKSFCGLSHITSLNLEKLSAQIGGEVHLPNKKYPEGITDKSSQLAFLAFEEALNDSKIDLSSLDPYRTALAYGTCNANVLTLEKILKNKPISPDIYASSVLTHFNGIDFINSTFDVKGEKIIFVTACAASNHAIGYAYDLIVNGEADTVIVGGADSFSLATFSGFNSLQSLAPDGTSPFSERLGISLGEGAGFLIVEEADNASKRDATVHGEILGYGFCGDAYHVTAPDISGEGARRSMAQALFQSGINPEKMKVICAHGTGTEANDKAETLAIKNVFKDHAQKLKITSTKSLYGHTLGASGVTQAIVMLECMKKGLIPPIINFIGQREGCDLSYVKNVPERLEYDCFLSNSFAFGGNNVSVILGKYRKCQVKSLKVSEAKIAITGFDLITPMTSDSQEFHNLFLKHLSEPQTPQNNLTFKTFFLKNPRFRKFGRAPLISKLAIEVIDRMITNKKLSLNLTEQLGLLFGVGKGPLKTFEKFYNGILDQGIEFGSALEFPHVVMNSVAGQVAIALGIKGCNTAICGQFSPINSIKYACDLLRKNIQKGVFVCGSDELADCDKNLAETYLYSGVTLTEGTAGLYLETEETAKINERKPICFIESVHCTSFSHQENFEESYKACIHASLKDSTLKWNDIDVHIGSAVNKTLSINPEIPFLTTQIVLGTLESSTAIIDIILGIYLLTDPDFSYQVLEKSVSIILVTAVSLNGNCYSLILRKA